jgi:hypothetical protein
VRFHLSNDWLFLTDISGWKAVAEERRRVRAASPPLDARRVLYGDALLHFIASECWATLTSPSPAVVVETRVDEKSLPIRSQEDMSGDTAAGPVTPANPDYNAIKDLHARWLLTPREELRGQAPRDLLLAGKDFLGWDLEDRCQQWSVQERCPPGLNAATHAYRYAAFGTHEIVTYYELVRYLFWACLDRVRQMTSASLATDAGIMQASDFLSSELSRLAVFREEWLDTPDPESHGLTPRDIIHRERARLPLGFSGHEAVVDHDCPVCQMMAEMPGPMFMSLDGCNMDSDFAFSFHQTRAEWEKEQQEYEEFSRYLDAKEAERKRLGVSYEDEPSTNPESPWRRSFSLDDSSSLPLGMRLFGIGSHLAELIVDLREPPGAQPLIEALNRDFGNLREVLQSQDEALTAALIEPALDRFCETLDTIAASRDDLAKKCHDLQHHLRRFLEAPVDAPRSVDSFDEELPF